MLCENEKCTCSGREFTFFERTISAIKRIFYFCFRFQGRTSSHAKREIDILETEWADKTETVQKKDGGWWTSVVKDESQLKEVFEYYDRK